MAHQSWFAVAATPLADSTPSDHDSPNAPATARSVYVIAHPAARLTHYDAGVTAPNLHTSGATANRPAPLQAGARYTRRGLRVGMVDSFGRSFVGGLISHGSPIPLHGQPAVEQCPGVT